MKRTRRKFSAPFKAKIAVEAIKEQDSLQNLASKFELCPNQISSWKRGFLENADLIFGSKSEKEDTINETELLYGKIGRLQVEVGFLKKALGKGVYCVLQYKKKVYP